MKVFLGCFLNNRLERFQRVSIFIKHKWVRMGKSESERDRVCAYESKLYMPFLYGFVDSFLLLCWVFRFVLIREQVQWLLLFDGERCGVCTAHTQSVYLSYHLAVLYSHTIEERRWTVKTIPHLPALTSKKVWQMNAKLKAFNGWSQRARLATKEKNTIISLCCRLFCRQITPFNMPKVNLHHTEWNSHNLLIFLFYFVGENSRSIQWKMVVCACGYWTSGRKWQCTGVCPLHMDVQDVKTNSCFNVIILVLVELSPVLRMLAFINEFMLNLNWWAHLLSVSIDPWAFKEKWKKHAFFFWGLKTNVLKNWMFACFQFNAPQYNEQRLFASEKSIPMIIACSVCLCVDWNPSWFGFLFFTSLNFKV